jgi:hypothetical protein
MRVERTNRTFGAVDLAGNEEGRPHGVDLSRYN